MTKVDFERILLLLSVIEKAAAVGASHMPFVSEAWTELGTMGAAPVDGDQI
jgi:hypothetical protein